MNFKFLENIINNAYVIELCLLFLACVIFVFEKKSVKIIFQILINVSIIAFGLIRGIFLDYNIIILNMITAFILCLINSIMFFGFVKKTWTSFFAFLIENTVLTACIIGCLYLRRINNNFEELNDTNLKLIFSLIYIITSEYCIKINYVIINSIDKLKDRTEEISWKILINKCIEKNKEIVNNDLNDVTTTFVLFAFISIMFMNNVNVDVDLTKEVGIEILVVTLLCMIDYLVSIFISSTICALIYRKKEIYKTTSNNKFDGECRTLKI